MKKIRLIAIVAIVSMFFNSCVVYHDDYYYGNAYLSLYAGDLYPSYIDTDGLLPDDFYYDYFYEVYSGYYSVYYEYTYDNGIYLVTDAYELYIEVWVEEGDYYETEDNYFYLDIWPDGYYDYYLKSGGNNTSKIGDVINKVEKTEGNYHMRATMKRVEVREKEKSVQ